MFVYFFLSACQNGESAGGDGNNTKNNTSGFKQSDQSRNNSNAIFSLVPSSQSNLDFNNEITDKIDINITYNDYFYNGGGVAIGDVNNDGLPDVYFTGNQVGNKLYLNKGDFKFEDITEKAGVADEAFWSTGASFLDINQDGWLDIYVCHAGFYKVYKQRQNHLYINNQDGTFTEQSKAYGLVDNSFSSQAAPIDYDLDGDMDLFVMNHTDFMDQIEKNAGVQQRQKLYETILSKGNNRQLYSNILFENTGNNTFVRKTKETGLLDWGFGLGLGVSDLNNDNLPDIYIANDYLIPDFLYYNNGDGTFTESIKESLGHTSQFSMGIDIADFNNDADPDIAIVDMTAPDRVRNKTLMRPMNTKNFRYIVDYLGYQKQFMFNAMQVNNGDGSFSEISHLLGTSQTDWSWSSLFADLDLDGDKDYMVSNGFLRDMKHRDIQNETVDVFKKQNKSEKAKKREQVILDIIKEFPSVPLTNYVFENRGEYEFVNQSKNWGFDKATFSNGMAYADLDLDGDLDLVVNNINETAHLYKNQSIEQGNGQFLKIKFDKDSKNLNAKVTVYSNGTNENVQFQEYNPVRGYFSCMEPVLHFGLNNKTKIDSIHIEWLYGKSQTLYNVESNQTLTLSINDDATKKSIKQQPSNNLFEEVIANKIGLDFKHKENNFADFKREVLLPHRQSRVGSHIAVADVNNDGLDDVFVGGAREQKGAIYIQKKGGRFEKSSQPALEQDKNFEDIGTTFFDFDQDGDLDLYVVSGGNEVKPFSLALRDRLYENNGKGNFKATNNIIPNVVTSGSKVKAFDYDNDGDLDLTIGGRSIPGNYPVPTRSNILRNENGVFANVTNEVIPGFNQLGLVTDFQWVDLNNDKQADLIVTGEWMNIEVFIQDGNDENSKFRKATKEYFSEETRGWWFSLAASDFDNDGDIDLIGGNLGTNNKFHASKKKPLDIYFNDFDENGTNDIVLAKTDEGEQYLLRGKDCSSEQMPFIKEKFETYEAFANAPLLKVLPEDKVEKSIHYSITDFSSIYFENTGGQFKAHTLPKEAQFAPINDILVKDLNNDGHLDAVLAGNLFDTEIETASYDAGRGAFMMGDGKGNFKAISPQQSGLRLCKNTRDLDWININGELHIIVANNDDVLQLIKVNAGNVGISGL